MREIERKLKTSRTSLRPYKECAESSGKSMDELLKMEDADLHAILSKEVFICELPLFRTA